ncbi:MAG: hypothetical protein ACTSPW_07170 [Promethearchaeota archaeon]
MKAFCYMILIVVILLYYQENPLFSIIVFFIFILLYLFLSKRGLKIYNSSNLRSSPISFRKNNLNNEILELFILFQLLNDNKADNHQKFLLKHREKIERIEKTKKELLELFGE